MTGRSMTLAWLSILHGSDQFEDPGLRADPKSDGLICSLVVAGSVWESLKHLVLLVEQLTVS
jgi:hypothetical protein